MLEGGQEQVDLKQYQSLCTVSSGGYWKEVTTSLNTLAEHGAQLPADIYYITYQSNSVSPLEGGRYGGEDPSRPGVASIAQRFNALQVGESMAIIFKFESYVAAHYVAVKITQDVEGHYLAVICDTANNPQIELIRDAVANTVMLLDSMKVPAVVSPMPKFVELKEATQLAINHIKKYGIGNFGVHLVLIHNKDVMLTDERNKTPPPKRKPYAFPGGKLDTLTEPLDLALKREIIEELGTDLDFLVMGPQETLMISPSDEGFLSVLFIQ